MSVILDEARKWVGKLHDGPDVPRLAADIAAVFPDLKSYCAQATASTAWCGIFQMWLLSKFKLRGPGPNSAGTGFMYVDRWADNDWGGTRIEPGQEQPGDIIALRSPHHVTMLIAVEGDHYRCVGGNQHDGVTEATFARSGLMAVMRPPAVGALQSVGPAHPLIRQGDSGTQVATLQTLLRIAVTGIFDAATDAAVRDYQRAHGLEVDGEVGDETWGALLGKPHPVSSDPFIAKAPDLARKLMADFALTDFQACGILGNLGHESGGFKQMQEISPLGGGAGGYGWAQWTGPRRTQFFAWCAENGLSVNSDEGNYGFLAHELQTTASAAIPAVRAATTLNEAVIAFEAKFERAGVKNYASRNAYAQRALTAFRNSLSIKSETTPVTDDPNKTSPEILPPLSQGAGPILPILLLIMALANKPRTDDPAAPAQGAGGLDLGKILLPLLLQAMLTGKPINVNDLLPALLQGLTGQPIALPAPAPQQPSPDHPAATPPASATGGLDMNALLPLVLGMFGVKPAATEPAKPVAPAPALAPAPVVVTPAPVASGSTAFGVLLAALTAGLQANGNIGTPFGMGVEPTTAGSLATIASLAAIPLGMTGMWGQLGGGLLKMGAAIFEAFQNQKKK